MNDALTVMVAKTICKHMGYDPDYIEPGDVPQIDAVLPNGDPGHFLWREFVPLAEKIIHDLRQWME